VKYLLLGIGGRVALSPWSSIIYFPKLSYFSLTIGQVYQHQQRSV
jgi:hypothetical protein